MTGDHTYEVTLYEGQTYKLIFPSTPAGINQHVDRYTWNLDDGLTADIFSDYKPESYSGTPTGTNINIVTYSDSSTEGDEHFQYVYGLFWQTDTPGIPSFTDTSVWNITLKDAKNQTGTSAANTMNGTPGGDSLNGAGGNDILNGLAGGDTLIGGAGNDKLTGGEGKDRLTGGDGTDKFVFAEAGPTNADAITDFRHNTDKILLDNDAFTKLGTATGQLKAGLFYSGTEAHDPNDRIIYDAGSGKLYYDPDGTGAKAQVLIATLVGSPDNVSASDFQVF
jgi:Ca2+-binding RTX toxin-like protein